MSWDWTQDTKAAVEVFFTEHDLLRGPFTYRPIGDGHSNLTYLINDAEREVVLRRPPPPPLPKGAHDVLREARVIAAIENSDVPAPTILATSNAGDVLDSPFYVMSKIEGIVITDSLPTAISDRSDKGAMVDAFIDALVSLHEIDWKAVGLADFGKPENFNKRHLERMAALLNIRKGEPSSDFIDVLEWLRENVPVESGATIIHNDFRLGNVMWTQGTPPRLAAVLDWELATIGDPLLDLGYVGACYPQKGVPMNPTQKLSAAWLEDGFPDRTAVLESYLTKTGRDGTHLPWYIAMAAWKLAVLYDYSRQRGEDAYYDDPDQATQFLMTAKHAAGMSR